MDTTALERMLDDAFDHAVVHHGYADHMRDYEVIVHMTADPRTGVAPAYLRYLFRFCVEARCETSVPAAVWKDSLDDRLIAREPGADLDGYVWGVRWHALCPGARLVPESDAARRWSEALGIDFHEVHIRTTAHDLTLVFSELQVDEVPVGYAPFVAD
ncbi:hypothetical protein CTU88_29480 [Streptomyces sp. JV178]|jgi:hypothetical protein|uniref:YxiG-like protein n=1 Tax=unclassified Streptomyces TaxID=2593676 RepID=UPI000C1B3CD5|nr:hypothetical protein [Streptomyces sp. JV178]PIM69005.1 hypothetical protein CTU88_29480 [Streptomyces sp. JV178]